MPNVMSVLPNIGGALCSTPQSLADAVTHGQCDARPTVTFPVIGHRRPLTGTNLYCLVTEAHMVRWENKASSDFLLSQ